MFGRRPAGRRLGTRVYPCRPGWKRVALAGAAAVLVAAAAGCGGGGGAHRTETRAVQGQQVRGAGYRFTAPAGWRVSRAGTGTIARAPSGPALVSVAVLTLRRRYRPAQFAQAATALDHVTSVLAGRLRGRVIARRSLVVAGISSRQYDLAYSRRGTGLIDRITYVLHGLTEYELLCRWPAKRAQTRACALLTATFRLQ